MLYLITIFNFHLIRSSVVKNPYLSRSLALILLFVLSACGGGGSPANTGPVASTETFQLRTAYVNYVTETRSLPFKVTGTTSGYSVTGSGTATHGALTSGTFESKAAQQKTTTVTGSITANGTTIPLSSSSTSYVDSNYTPLGTVDTGYTVVNSDAFIPNTARVNDTGILYSTILYKSSTKAVKQGTGTVVYVLEPDTASTALLKIIGTVRSIDNTQTSVSTITFRITTAGAITRISETFVEGATSLTLTF